MKLYDRFLMEQDDNFSIEYLKYNIKDSFIPSQDNKVASKTIFVSDGYTCFIHKITDKKALITLISLDNYLVKKEMTVPKLEQIIGKYKMVKCKPIFIKVNNDINLTQNYYELGFINRKKYNLPRVYTKEIFMVNNQFVCSIFNTDDFIPLDNLIFNTNNTEHLKKFIFNFRDLKMKIKIQELMDTDYLIKVEAQFAPVQLPAAKYIGIHNIDDKIFKVFVTSNLIKTLKEIRANVLEMKGTK